MVDSKTTVFPKHYKKRIDGTELSVKAKSDTATIRFTDAQGTQNKAKMSLLCFNQVIQHPLFNTKTNFQEWYLINHWMISYDNYTLLLYSGSKQQAILYNTRTANAFEEFLFLIEKTGAFNKLMFTREKQFTLFCRNRLKMELKQLKELPGMDTERLSLLARKKTAFERLITNGCSLDKLGAMHLEVLASLLRSRRPAEQRVTIQPEVVQTKQHSVCFKCLGIDTHCTVSSQTFSYHHKNNRITIQHKNGSLFTLTTLPVSSFQREPLDASLQNEALICLVNHWFLIQETQSKDTIKKTYYCPARSEIIAEEYEATFPLALLKTAFSHLLQGVSLYSQHRFSEKMAASGIPLDWLKSKYYMTAQKLELIALHPVYFKRLLNKGFTIREVGQIPDNKLATLFYNFETNDQTCSPKELKESLELRPQRSHYTPRLFDHDPKCLTRNARLPDTIQPQALM